MRILSIALAATLLACTVPVASTPAPALPWGDRADGKLVIGLRDGPGAIVTDDAGVAHIYANSDYDLMKLQGLLHGRERLFQMDILRRLARGKLTGLLGQKVIDTDIYYRTVMTTPRGNRVENEISAQLPSEIRKILSAYAEGVNLAIARVKSGADPAPVEYAALSVQTTNIAAWTIEDSIALGRLQSFFLSDFSDQELTQTQWASRLPADLASDLLDPRPLGKDLILPGYLDDPTPYHQFRAVPHVPRAVSAPNPDTALARSAGSIRRMDTAHRARLIAMLPQIDAALALAKHRLGRPVAGRNGSNNWVIAPRLTATGNPMLLNDPHLSLQFPSNFHIATLDSKTAGHGSILIGGAAFPGIPGVVIGCNERIAWGLTVVGYDVTDLYAEKIVKQDGADATRFQGTNVPILQISESFEAGPGESAATTHVIEIVPQHGPILPGTRGATSAISMRWTGQEPTNELAAFFGLWHAQGVDDAMLALKSFLVGAQNFVLADVAGHIAYDPHACVPRRTGDLAKFPPWLVLPGTGEVEWSGCIPDAELPHARDPLRGFVATSNGDIVGKTVGGDPLAHGEYWYQAQVDFGLREERITALILDRAGARDGGKVTLDDLRAIQHDVHSNLADHFLPRLLAAAAHRPDLAAPVSDAIARLTAWSGRSVTGFAGATFDTGIDPAAQADAVAASIFNAWFPRARAHLTGSLLASIGDPSDDAVVSLAARILSDPGSLHAAAKWRAAATSSVSDAGAPGSDAAIDAALLADLAAATAFLRAAPGLSPDPSSWLWGRLHPLTLQHPLHAVGDLRFDDGPFPAPGENFSVNVASFSGSGTDFADVHGANLRIVHELAPDGITTFVTWPGGESGIPGDPRSDDELQQHWLVQTDHRLPVRAIDVATMLRAVLRVE